LDESVRFALDHCALRRTHRFINDIARGERRTSDGTIQRNSPAPMDYSLLSLVVMLCAMVAALSVAARRLRVASPILMLVAGGALAFVPGMPRVALDPELVLLVLLPPLLYSSGVGMSWRGFRSNLRPILLLAIGCVLVTAGAVAAVMHYALGLGRRR